MRVENIKKLPNYNNLFWNIWCTRRDDRISQIAFALARTLGINGIAKSVIYAR